MAQVPGTESLYPLSSTDGQAIPLDLVDIFGLMREDFDDTSSVAIAIPDEAEFLIFYATESCYVQFDDTVAAEPAEGSFSEGLIYVPAGTIKVVAKAAHTTFAVIRDTANGKLIVEMGRLWRDLRAIQQQTNIG